MARHKKQPGKDARKAAEQSLKAADTSHEWRLDQIRWKDDGSHFINFGMIYYPRIFYWDFPLFVKEIFRDYYKYLINYWAEPRAAGKTTWLKLIFLYNAATYKHDDIVPPEYQSPCSLYIGKTQKQANRFVKSVRSLLLNNPHIREDFGVLTGDGEMSASELNFVTGKAVIGAGSLAGQRGLLTEANDRPTDIGFDDLIDKRLARNPERMAEIKDWLLEEVFGLEGDQEARIVGLCNRMSWFDPYGLLQQEFKGTPDWNFVQHSIVKKRNDKGEIVESLWPERFPVEKLRKIEGKVGKKAFRIERENRPTNVEELTFSTEDIRRYSFRKHQAGEKWPMKIACDPATSKGGKKSSRAVVLAAKLSPERQRWIVGGFKGKMKLTVLAHRIVQMIEYYHPYVKEVRIEGVGAFEVVIDLVKDELREKEIRVKVIDAKPDGRDKDDRIESIAPAVESGDIRICDELVWLIEQLEVHPESDQKDGPDCLEILDRGFRKKTAGTYAGPGVRIFGADTNRNKLASFQVSKLAS